MHDDCPEIGCPVLSHSVPFLNEWDKVVNGYSGLYDSYLIVILKRITLYVSDFYKIVNHCMSIVYVFVPQRVIYSGTILQKV